jgi:hypothetical protein
LRCHRVQFAFGIVPSDLKTWFIAPQSFLDYRALVFAACFFKSRKDKVFKIFYSVVKSNPLFLFIYL